MLECRCSGLQRLTVSVQQQELWVGDLPALAPQYRYRRCIDWLVRLACPATRTVAKGQVQVCKVCEAR